MAMELHRPVVAAMSATLLAVLRDGRSADRSIEFALKRERKWGSRDRRAFAETVYDVIRWWRRLQAWYGFPHLGADPETLSATSEADVNRALHAYFSLIIGREAPEWLVAERPLAHPSPWSARAATAAIEHSLPDWLEAHGQAELGSEWPTTMVRLNHQAPVFLRVNRLKTTLEEARAALTKLGIQTEPVTDLADGLRLAERRNVFVTKEFQAGWFEVQDGGSQLIAPLLAPESGERVIDACAGAGGKTLHLAALMKNRGRIIALDVHGGKLEELKRRVRRSGASLVEVREISSRKVIKRLADSADRVLLDVPCTGSGVWRRNPDARWKLTETRRVELLAIQAEILRDYSRMVRPGGTLVYATCSLWPSENEHQVQTFLAAQNGEFELERELRTSPVNSDFDGFYAARMRRRT